MNHRWIEAEDEYLKALAIDPQSASVLEDYNEFLDGVGHWDKSIEYGEFAARLEPFRPVFQMASAFRPIGANAAGRAIAGPRAKSTLNAERPDERIPFRIKELRRGPGR